MLTKTVESTTAHHHSPAPEPVLKSYPRSVSTPTGRHPPLPPLPPPPPGKNIPSYLPMIADDFAGGSAAATGDEVAADFAAVGGKGGNNAGCCVFAAPAAAAAGRKDNIAGCCFFAADEGDSEAAGDLNFLGGNNYPAAVHTTAPEEDDLPGGNNYYAAKQGVNGKQPPDCLSECQAPRTWRGKAREQAEDSLPVKKQ